MSRRGRGKGRGNRGGGGKGNNKARYAKRHVDKKKKTLSDYNYYLGSSRQASDYETTTSFIINYIKKTYEDGGDVSVALKTLEPLDTTLWKPSLAVSLIPDDTEDNIRRKEAEEAENAMIFKIEWSDYASRLKTYKNNLLKSYALIWERCTRAMKDKIESRDDFASTIEDDPIELLKAIKQHALNYQEYRYSMAIIADSLKNMIHTRQRDNETLHEYAKRFKTATEIFTSHLGGSLIMANEIRRNPNYNDNLTDDQKSKIANAKYEQLLSFLFLEQADQSKYGSLLTNLSSQHSLNNDQYPRTLSQASNVLSNHRHDPPSADRSRKKKTATENSEPATPSSTSDDEPNLSFAQIEQCYCCGSKDHKSPKCPLKDKKPKNEWWFNRVQQHFQEKVSDTSGSSNNSGKSGRSDKSPSNTTIQTTTESDQPNTNNNPEDPAQVAWLGLHLGHVQLLEQQYPRAHMQEWILLDSQSSTSIFCNPKFVKNIRNISNNEQSLLVETNGGPFEVTQKATVDLFGEVWYDPSSITNIFSHAEMADKYRITYDNHNKTNGDSFVVHIFDTKVKFERLTNNLYVYKPRQRDSPSPNSTLSNVNMMNTLEENRNFYTERQFERAKRARDLYHAIGTPSVNDFKAVIKMNAIGNNPVTAKDIQLAEKIFGPDIGSLKGKSTRRQPIPVVEDMIEIPRALLRSQQEVTLCMDAMKVNGLWFLTTISKNLYYRTAQFVLHQTTACYREALLQVMRLYNRGGFRIARIHVDNEFRPLLEPMENEFEFRVNYANPQDHVPEAERNNRTIKEHVRATYHRLPFKQLTKIMTKVLVMDGAKKLNFFPARNGVSQFYSPRMILSQRNLDYNKHCRYAFGTYVQASHEPHPTNTQEQRTLDCIYMQYVDGDQGGHECLHLPTNRLIRRSRVTPIPITPGVIAQVQTLATADQMAAGLKIENKAGLVLYDSAWIAGVDFDDDDYDSDYSDNENESDNDTDDEDDDDDDDDDDDGIGQYDELEEEFGELQSDDESENGPTYEVQEWQPNAIPPARVQPAQPTQAQQQPNPTEVVEEEAAATPQAQDEVYPEPVREGPDPTVTTTRSGRISRPPDRFDDYHMHLQTQAHPEEKTMEYGPEEARFMAQLFEFYTTVIEQPSNRKVKNVIRKYHNFLQTYSLKAGLKKFKTKGREATLSEMKQIDDRAVFYPIDIRNMTPVERQRAMESLLFIVEKRDGRVKARFCANGSTQREYMDREESASPTVYTESIFITSTIDAKQRRDIMTCDIPNAFVQTDVEVELKGKRIMMKIRGVLVDILLELDYWKYEPYVTHERGRKVLYVVMSKALYGMLQSSLLYYRKFRKDIESIGFVVNPYDPCVANRMINGKQHTVCWHVDDLKSSHVDPEVNDNFLVWLNERYGEIAEVKAHRGNRHDYLAMFIQFPDDGTVKIDMAYYVKNMLKEFPEKVPNSVRIPWTERLYKVDPDSKPLEKERKELFHTFVMKAMFLCKRGRPDIQPAIAFLCTRVTESTEQDMKKLIRLLGFLKSTQDEILTLACDNHQTVEFWVDVAFAVHPDYKSHTGCTYTLGKGSICSISTKQKVNSRSSTEAELIGIDDVISKALWTKRFIESQGFPLQASIVYRDNTSSIKLEENGRASTSKRTRHFNIKLFYITDLIQCKEFTLRYCHTSEMLADYFTKPLIGASFVKMRERIMNSTPVSQPVLEPIVRECQQECVGESVSCMPTLGEFQSRAQAVI